eukprot:900689-Alexandrium_andersonii.AAC.1
MRRYPASKAAQAARRDVARSMRSLRSWSLMARCCRPASSRRRPPGSGASAPEASVTRASRQASAAAAKRPQQ